MDRFCYQGSRNKQRSTLGPIGPITGPEKFSMDQAGCRILKPMLVTDVGDELYIVLATYQAIFVANILYVLVANISKVSQHKDFVT